MKKLFKHHYITLLLIAAIVVSIDLSLMTHQQMSYLRNINSKVLIAQESTPTTNAKLKTLIAENKTVIEKTHKAARFIMIGDALNLALIALCIFLLNRQLTSRILTEQKLQASEKELFHIAYFDSLTGLINQNKLTQDLQESILLAEKTHTHTALLYLDIDNFKMINDSFDYTIGDELLRLFPLRIKKDIPETCTISRLNGNKFAVLIPSISSVKKTESIVQCIMINLVEPFIVKDHKLFITASLGISMYPDNGHDAQSILKNAEIAMHYAKERGKNNYQLCTPELTLKVEERAQLEYHLRQAIQNNEFVLLYQPKIDLQSGKLSGVEALIRWYRKDGELVYPSQFISIAESNGLIVPLGEWMLRSACSQGKHWHTMGFPVPIAINVSTRQLNTSDFVSSVKNVLNEIGFDPELLEIEITESILMENTFNNITALRILRDMGIKLTIDDFGTGFSSLSYLSSFPIDKLKIDQSFIRQITTMDYDPSIINAMIMMAHNLKIKVIAEGVETPEQVALLKKFKCDEAQGFFYSIPLPCNEVEKIIRQHSQEH